MHAIVNLVIAICSLFLLATSQSIHRRFEYKYSFKGPYLAQKDNQVPFWTYSGSAIASEESFRITPSLRSQKGQAWSKNPTFFDWWEVEIVFRVNGRGRIGADGLAFWYTVTPGVEGPVFGSSDKWNGFGLFFDSFDNDNKRNNPYVMGMVNDGTLEYDHEHDGLSQQLGGCLRDFRNKPFPIRAKIEYFKNILTVFIHNGMTDNEKDYEICFRAENVHLPQAGHFGVTAATGGLADDHDVLKLLVHSLRSSEEMAQLRHNLEEEEKFEKEFEQYQQKTQKARDAYIAEHPDAARKTEDFEYETGEQRELRQIFQGQGQIFDFIRQLSLKLDEVIGRQERTLSLVSGGQVAVGQQGQLPPSPGGGADLNAVLNNQREVMQNVRDMKTIISDVQSKSQQLLSRAQGSVEPVAGAGGGSAYEFHVTLKELNEGLNIVKRDLGIANQKLGTASIGDGLGCAQVSCLSTSVFIIFMAFQIVVLLGYFLYRDSKEAKAKKFY